MSRNRKTKSNAGPAGETPKHLEISEEEQWRIINETGILNKVPRPLTKISTDDDEELISPLAEEIFNSVTLIMPFTFLLILFEMYVSI